MKSIYTLPFILFIQTIHSKNHCSSSIDFAPSAGSNANVVQNSRTYTTVGSEDNAWSTSTKNLIDSDAFFGTSDVAAIINDINEVADYASHGLRTLSSNYEQVATDTERKRCDFASGSRLDLTSEEDGGNNLAKIVWQVKELALFIKIGLVKEEQFTVFNNQIVNCINHLPGRHENLKSQVSRDMAMFDSVIHRDLPSASADSKSSPLMKDTTVSSISSYSDYYASTHGKSTYTHLFGNLPALSIDFSSLTVYNCPEAVTEITDSDSLALFESFAFQVAMGLTQPSSCDIDVDTFEIEYLNVLALMEEGDELVDRKLAYETAMNAINQRDADFIKLKYDRNSIGIAFVVLFLTILTYLSRDERLMIDEIQKKEDEENSKPVQVSFKKL